MTVPLVVLAFFAAVAGFINLPFSGSTKWLENWLAPVTGRYGAELTYSNATIVLLLTISTVVALTGIGLAYLVYLRKRIPAEPIEPRCSPTAGTTTAPSPRSWAARAAAFADGLAWFDRTVIDGAVNGIGAAVRDSGNTVRRVQTGYVRTYALGMTIGAVALLVYIFTRVQF